MRKVVRLPAVAAVFACALGSLALMAPAALAVHDPDVSIFTGTVFPILTSGIAVDDADYAYVNNPAASQVEKYSSSGGQKLSGFGSHGSGPGQFSSPAGVARDNSGNFYVADSGNNRVEKFNSSGVYQSQVGINGSGNGQFNTPQGLAIDSAGNIFVADYGNNRVQKFNSSGVYQSKFGSFGTGNGQFKLPAGVA